MGMSNKIVLAFSGNGANDAIRGLMLEYGNALLENGVPVVHISLERGELDYAMAQISAGNVAFGLTFLGIGQDLSVQFGSSSEPRNVWEAFRLPLLKLHGDLPAYFVDFHLDIPNTAVNLYHATEFIDFRKRWLPECRAITSQVPPLPLAPTSLDALDRSRRRNGKLVFLKNGNDPAELRRLWSERLPSSISSMLFDLADDLSVRALKPGTLRIGDVVGDYLESRGIVAESLGPLVLFFSAQMDDYLRRVKSALIATALLDFPVIIQGKCWEHIDFAGRRALYIQGADYSATQEVFANELGIIDMSANVDSWPHDRVQRAAGSFALCLTNKQGWLRDQFTTLQDLTFDFSKESIQTCIANVLARPDNFLDLAVEFGQRFRQVYSAESFSRHVLEMATLASVRWSEDKPILQPFFVWSRFE
jgi:hypothetical protein